MIGTISTSNTRFPFGSYHCRKLKKQFIPAITWHRTEISFNISETAMCTSLYEYLSLLITAAHSAIFFEVVNKFRVGIELITPWESPAPMKLNRRRGAGTAGSLGAESRYRCIKTPHNAILLPVNAQAFVLNGYTIDLRHAYRTSVIVAIYPIPRRPASPSGSLHAIGCRMTVFQVSGAARRMSLR